MRVAPALVLLAAAALSCPVRAQPAQPGPQAERHLLSNGTAVLVAPARHAPMVVVTAVVDAGARLDPPGREGLASLVADLVTEASRSRPARELSETLDSLGASLWSSAGRDSASVQLRVLSRDLEVGVDLLADVLGDAALAAPDLERRRRAAIASLRADEENPTTVALRAFLNAVHGSGPYGHPVAGTIASVKAITREDVLRFYRAHYRPGATQLVVVGDVDVANVLRLLERRFGSWRGAAPTAAPKAAAAPPSGRTIRIRKPVAQAAVVIGHEGVPRTHPDYEALQVMNYILGGGGFSSRLMERLRNREGLVYGVYSAFVAGLEGGEFRVVLQTRNDAVPRAREIVREEIERIRREPVSGEELRDAILYLTGSFPLRLDSNREVAEMLSAIAVYDLGLDYPQRYLRRIAAVTADDVLRVARAHLHPDRLVEVVVSRGASPAATPASVDP